MTFNVNKCNVMHYGFNNPSYEYLMNDEVLIDTKDEGGPIYRFLGMPAMRTGAAAHKSG